MRSIRDRQSVTDLWEGVCKLSRLLDLPGEPESLVTNTTAHGGDLVSLVATPERAAGLKAASTDFPSWDLTDRQLCDLELLSSGGFSPLRGFMDHATYESVCSDMRLRDGTIWPMPIVLDVTQEAASKLGRGDDLALRDSEGVMLAV